MDAPQPAELSLGRGARVSIVPEVGSDAGEMAHELFQLFANRGYYQLVDRANLGQKPLEQPRPGAQGNLAHTRTRLPLKGEGSISGALPRRLSGSQQPTGAARLEESWPSCKINLRNLLQQPLHSMIYRG